MPLLPLLQDTPNTAGYMLLGYAFLIGVPILYVASWFVRQRNLRRDLELIETLAEDERKKKAAAAGQAGSATTAKGSM